jgi:hypothetical protein
MASIYLINVGANTAHSSQARCPLFLDEAGGFEYVPFPHEECRQTYPQKLFPYVKPEWRNHAHLDPDWEHLTYGDCCSNQRARALRSAKPGDVLLFWALLWHIRDRKADVFAACSRGWYLIGALRVQCVLKSGESVQCLPSDQQRRLLPNAHMVGSMVMVRDGVPDSDRVFLSDTSRSAKFERAVDLEVYEDNGLLRQTVTDKNGRALSWNASPRWSSVTRSCRAILDTTDSRAKILRDRIQSLNPSFDLLSGCG